MPGPGVILLVPVILAALIPVLEVVGRELENLDKEEKPQTPQGYRQNPKRFSATAWTGSPTLPKTGVRVFFRTPDGGIQEIGAQADPNDQGSYIKWDKQFYGAQGQVDELSAISAVNSVGLAGANPAQIRVFFQRRYQNPSNPHPLGCLVYDWGKGWYEDPTFTTESAYRGCGIAAVCWSIRNVVHYSVFWNDAGTVYEKTKIGDGPWSGRKVISTGGRPSDIAASVWVKKTLPSPATPTAVEGPVFKRVYVEKEATAEEKSPDVKYILHELSWTDDTPNTWSETPITGTTKSQNVTAFAFPDGSGTQRLFVSATDGLTGELRKDGNSTNWTPAIGWKGWKDATDFSAAAQVQGNKKWYIHFFLDSGGWLNMCAFNSERTENNGYYKAAQVLTAT